METAVAIGAAVFGGMIARSWYMAIVLGTILGVVARYAYVWFAAGAVARWEVDGSLLATVLGTAVAALLVHLLVWWRRRA